MPIHVRLLPSLPLLLFVPGLLNLSLMSLPNIILPKSHYLVLHLPILHHPNAQPNSWKNWLASTLSPGPNFFDRWTMRLPHPVSHVLPRLLDSLSHVAPPCSILQAMPHQSSTFNGLADDCADLSTAIRGFMSVIAQQSGDQDAAS